MTHFQSQTVCITYLCLSSQAAGLETCLFFFFPFQMKGKTELSLRMSVCNQYRYSSRHCGCYKPELEITSQLKSNICQVTSPPKLGMQMSPVSISTHWKQSPYVLKKKKKKNLKPGKESSTYAHKRKHLRSLLEKLSGCENILHTFTSKTLGLRSKIKHHPGRALGRSAQAEETGCCLPKPCLLHCCPCCSGCLHPLSTSLQAAVK